MTAPAENLRPQVDMGWIPGGTFLMGSDQFYLEERPAQPAAVDGFWMDRHPVTNAEFRRFVSATSYRTTAERVPDAQDFPGVPREALVPGSLVFQPPSRPVPLHDHSRWWAYVPWACWSRPEGPGSDLAGRDRHPVVHVTHEDAAAYARWIGKALPSEVEWEFAARGGLEGSPFTWGDEAFPEGRVLANIWLGAFPWQNLAPRGFEWTSPVGSFPPNGYGLFDMAGNVWEWTTDVFAEHGRAAGCCGDAPGSAPRLRRVIKGGSHLCAPNYCFRFRPAARQGQEVDASTSHVGFRCILRSPEAGH